MMDKRERLAAIFRDTQQFYSTDPELMAAIDAGRKNTKLYDVGNIPDFPEEATRAGAVSVTQSRTYEAAMRLAKQHPGKRIAVRTSRQRQSPAVVSSAAAARRRRACAGAPHCIRRLTGGSCGRRTMMLTVQPGTCSIPMPASIHRAL